MGNGAKPDDLGPATVIEQHRAPKNSDAELEQLYRDFAAENLNPLWTQLGDLMPQTPRPQAVPHLWRWDILYPLAQRAGDLVPVGRGGERRAMALANPGLGGAPYAAPTLWAAIQYLGPWETAPEHRHSQNAFRFIIEGEGVWTVVNGDPVAMRRGDFLLTPGWNFHGHYNDSDSPMAWVDGLDLPFVHYTDTSFFEFGSERVTDEATPPTSRAERLWAYPGLDPHTNSPISAYRWEYTDRALAEQLLLEDEGQPATVEPGHAAVRYTNPTTGGDVMPTLRAEFHRLRPGASTRTRRDVGSSVWQVFDGEGSVTLDGREERLGKGDLFVVPSWISWSLQSAKEHGIDLFRFSDAPIIERLHFHRTFIEGHKS